MLNKYNLGNIPSPEDIEGVAKYIDRLLELQQLAKLLQMQKNLGLLDTAVQELNDLKKTDPNAFRDAMNKLLGGPDSNA